MKAETSFSLLPPSKFRGGWGSQSCHIVWLTASHSLIQLTFDSLLKGYFTVFISCGLGIYCLWYEDIWLLMLLASLFLLCSGSRAFKLITLIAWRWFGLRLFLVSLLMGLRPTLLSVCRLAWGTSRCTCQAVGRIKALIVGSEASKVVWFLSRWALFPKSSDVGPQLWLTLVRSAINIEHKSTGYLSISLQYWLVFNSGANQCIRDLGIWVQRCCPLISEQSCLRHQCVCTSFDAKTICWHRKGSLVKPSWAWSRPSASIGYISRLVYGKKPVNWLC